MPMQAQRKVEIKLLPNSIYDSAEEYGSVCTSCHENVQYLKREINIEEA